jgi:hypothetical protein
MPIIEKPVWPAAGTPTELLNDTLNQMVDYGEQEASLARHFRATVVAALQITIAAGALTDGIWQDEQTVDLAPSADNYVELDTATGTAQLGTGAFTGGSITPLFFAKTDSGSVLNLDGDNPALGADDSIFDRRGWTGGSGSVGATVVDQTAHGFALENVLAFDGANWLKAQADAMANCAGTLGIVAEVVSADRVKIQTVAGAHLDFLSGKTPGAKYYLSAVTAGALTGIMPSTVGQCIAEVLTAESATTGFLSPMIVVEIAAPVDLSGLQSNERRRLTMTGDTTATSDDLKVRLLVLRGTPTADSVLTLPDEEFLIFVTNETGVNITVTRDTSGVTDTLPPEPDATATRLYKWIP